MRGLVLALATVLVCSACAGGGDADSSTAAEWDGTIATEGDTTTVVNLSGSVWGGDAILVEEASIGVLEGAEEYMLGTVSAIAYDDDRIIVADRQVPVVRIYDSGGTYERDLGGVGEGPGEYQQPASVAVANDGRILVRDDSGRRIVVYGRDGEYQESYPLTGGLQTGTPMQLGPDGTPYTIVIVETLENDPSRLWVLGMQAHGPDGPHGEPIVPPTQTINDGVIVARREGGTSMRNVPFWPTESWTLTPNLDVVSGVATEYRFQILRSNGSQVVVQHRTTPTPVQPGEADWYRRQATAQMRDMDPSWVWNGPEIPATKPAFGQLMSSRSGEVWVLRAGAGERLTPCNEAAETNDEFASQPCWLETSSFDVFGSDGRYLGAVEVPAGMSRYPVPYIDGDTVIGRVEDADGTIYVKRFRRIRRSDS